AGAECQARIDDDVHGTGYGWSRPARADPQTGGDFHRLHRFEAGALPVALGNALDLAVAGRYVEHPAEAVDHGLAVDVAGKQRRDPGAPPVLHARHGEIETLFAVAGFGADGHCSKGLEQFGGGIRGRSRQTDGELPPVVRAYLLCCSGFWHVVSRPAAFPGNGWSPARA